MRNLLFGMLASVFFVAGRNVRLGANRCAAHLRRPDDSFLPAAQRSTAASSRDAPIADGVRYAVQRPYPAKPGGSGTDSPRLRRSRQAADFTGQARHQNPRRRRQRAPLARSAAKLVRPHAGQPKNDALPPYAKPPQPQRDRPAATVPRAIEARDDRPAGPAAADGAFGTRIESEIRVTRQPAPVGQAVPDGRRVPGQSVVGRWPTGSLGRWISFLPDSCQAGPDLREMHEIAPYLGAALNVCR